MTSCTFTGNNKGKNASKMPIPANFASFLLLYFAVHFVHETNFSGISCSENIACYLAVVNVLVSTVCIRDHVEPNELEVL